MVEVGWRIFVRLVAYLSVLARLAVLGPGYLYAPNRLETGLEAAPIGEQCMYQWVLRRLFDHPEGCQMSDSILLLAQALSSRSAAVGIGKG